MRLRYTTTNHWWAIAAMFFCLLPSLGAQGFEFLPNDVYERVLQVEEARDEWESRRAEVIRELSIQPWEEEEEYAQRVDRAVSRGAGREFRFLQFEARELEQHRFYVDQNRITLRLMERPTANRPWTMEIRTDLGFLPDADTFLLSVAPNERDEAESGHYELARAVEDGSLQGRIGYTLRGSTDGSYQIILKTLHLLDSSRPGPAFRSIPVNRYYAFSRYEPIAVVQPEIRHTFQSGEFPTGFETGGDLPWTITDDPAYTGDHTLRSGAIDHGMQTTLRYMAPVPAGAATATITFAVRVSSEPRYDFLAFHINGEQRGTWSGAADWETASFEADVLGGDQLELVWRYEKDGSVTQGADSAWVDDIRITYE
jgi:hypothetical protein